MYNVTKQFNFEAGHCLAGHPGKCKNLHGHNYKVFVTMSSETLDNLEMVYDFYNLNSFAKPMFDEFDHSFIYNLETTDEFEKEIFGVCKKHEKKIKMFPGRATAENMSRYFYNILNQELKQTTTKDIKITKVTVYETDTSFATYEEK